MREEGLRHACVWLALRLLLVGAAAAGDLAPSLLLSLSASFAGARYLAAITDNTVHALVAALVWLAVEFSSASASASSREIKITSVGATVGSSADQLPLSANAAQQAAAAVPQRPSTTAPFSALSPSSRSVCACSRDNACMRRIAGCFALGSLLDLDHFASAGSVRLRDALSLPERPLLHSSLVVLCIGALLAALFARRWPNLPFMVWGSFLSHHLRDSYRRGLTFWPLDAKIPVSYNGYLLCLFLLPTVIVSARQLVVRPS
jgi:hypothetical protein